MRPNYCLTMFHVSILVTLILTLEADSEDSNCEVQIRVRRHTVYRAFLGDIFRMNCPVGFCNNSPPTVSWFKVEETPFPINVSSSSHIKTEWKRLKQLEGESYLVFQNILTSDSGVYRCQSDGSQSHNIILSVHVRDDEHTSVTKKNDTKSSTTQDNVWLYRLVGIMVFVIIVTIIYITSKSGCKGVCCAGESRDTPDPSCQPSTQALSTMHIYENDQ